MAKKGPRRVRFIEVQPSKGTEGNLPPFKGKNGNVIMPDIHKNVAKNSKFVDRKPPIPKARKAVSENSFREVEITLSNHKAREAKDRAITKATDRGQQKGKEGGDQMKDMKGDNRLKDEKSDDQPKDKKGDDQLKDKKGDDQPKDKKGDDQLKDKKGDDQPKDMKGDGQLKDKTGDDQPKDKKGDENSAEGKKEKRKKKKKNRKRKNKHVLPVDNESGQAGDTPDAGQSARGKKNKEQMKTKPAKKTDMKDDSVKAASSEKEPMAEEAASNDANSRRKLPCLFGFIATWIAKRKEKRREKKRRAIASRDPPKQLVEYEHRAARGGEAFTIELDSRPITLKKPLLPPIKQTPGPLLRERYHDADCRRSEKLAQRKHVAKEYERKKTRCKENKAETDRQFRHKTELGIKLKQVIAERNRELQSRCKSKLRTPSTGMSPEPLKEPSAKSSLGSVYGPSLYSDNEVDRDDLSVDIPIF